jgi:hypothetical protein
MGIEGWDSLRGATPAVATYSRLPDSTMVNISEVQEKNEGETSE